MNCALIVLVVVIAGAWAQLEEAPREKRGLEHGGGDVGASAGGHAGLAVASSSYAAGGHALEAEHHGGYEPVHQHVNVFHKPLVGPKVKVVKVAVAHPVHVPVAVPHPVPVAHPVPHYVPVVEHVPVLLTKAIPVPVEKPYHVYVERKVPITVEKPYEVAVEKPVHVPVPKPYPVHVPVYKHVYHEIKGGWH